MPKFRIRAQSISDVYPDVEADTYDEAYEIAEDTDGGEFIEDTSPCSGDWVMRYDPDMVEIIEE